MFWFFLFEVFYCAAIIPIKLSIALMLIRIAQNRKVYVYAQWATMTLFFLADGGALFYIIFQCKPISYVRACEDGCRRVKYRPADTNIVMPGIQAVMGIVCQRSISPMFTTPSLR